MSEGISSLISLVLGIGFIVYMVKIETACGRIKEIHKKLFGG